MKHSSTFLIICLSLIVTTATAQSFQASLSGYTSAVLGDFSNKNFNDRNSGYADYGVGSSLNLKYYKNNLGLALRWSFTSYYRDETSYNKDLFTELGIIDDNYNETQSKLYFNFSPKIGFSYVLNLSEKFRVEPYLYVGLSMFTTPFDHVTYFSGGNTFTYRKDPTPYFGGNVNPGINLMFNVNKRIGIYLDVEYEALFLSEETETAITTSYNSYTKNETNKKYSPQTVNIGLGLAYNFSIKKKKKVE